MDLKESIKEIISKEQFKISQNVKNRLLLPILKEEIKHNIEFSSILKKFYYTLGKDPDLYKNVTEIPPIPVSMFKKFDLKTCPDDEISRTLHSSATTKGFPSKIYINKETSFRQSKALATTLKNLLGGKRRPLLVIDTKDINKRGVDILTARGAAVRGISNFARRIEYIMEEKDGELQLDSERLKRFSEEYSGQEILVSGFTYIIWSRFVNQIAKSRVKLNFPKMKLVHSGGWKKLKAQAVTKSIFSNTLSDIFGTQPKNIVDFYGMVEQLGVVFLDCEEGYKHVPDFSDVIIRDIYSMNECRIREPGLIEILSIIPSSYPGQAIITEDIGELIGIDDCPCGRKSKYFVFKSRVEKTETRGCGDTFAEAQGDI